MSTAVDVLQNWFGELSREQQEEIIDFLYKGKTPLYRQGNYYGHHPAIAFQGLHCGPAPSQTLATQSTPAKVCPTCGKLI